jgi:hypothetical protein
MKSKICTSENCPKKSRQLGMCPTHVSRYYRHRNKEKALDYLGSKCANCGSTDRLEFDHIDHTNVGFRVSQQLAASWEVLKAELDKCQLLCHTCHWIKTCKDLSKTSYQTTPHGTTNAYCNYDCRCALCKKAWADYWRKKRALNKQRS